MPWVTVMKTGLHILEKNKAPGTQKIEDNLLIQIRLALQMLQQVVNSDAQGLPLLTAHRY